MSCIYYHTFQKDILALSCAIWKIGGTTKVQGLLLARKLCFFLKRPISLLSLDLLSIHDFTSRWKRDREINAGLKWGVYKAERQ